VDAARCDFAGQVVEFFTLRPIADHEQVSMFELGDRTNCEIATLLVGERTHVRYGGRLFGNAEFAAGLPPFFVRHCWLST